MSIEPLVAIGVAVLPPQDVAQRAIELSASLPDEESEGFRLGPQHLPHVTLTQQYVRDDELEVAFARVGDVLREQRTFRLGVTGGGTGSSSIWMVIERAPDLVALHEALMEALRGVERYDGGPAAFVEHSGRIKDVLWVAGYRLRSSFGEYTPHITLGHGTHPPTIEPFAFEATTVAVCHLGRFCTCQRALRSWTLTTAPRTS